MIKRILVALLALPVSMVSAQQTVVKDPNAQVRKVSGYHAIEVSNAIDLYLNQGGEEAVAVSARDEKHINQIITEVDNGVLKIKMENTGRIMWNNGNQKLKAYVSFKKLDRLSASGSSDVYVDGAITGDNLTIHLSGSSDFKGSVKLTDLDLDQSGSSDALISGSTGNLAISLSGASDVKGYDLVADRCTVHASGSSDIQITVNKELNAHASGSSDIYYKGTAVIKELHTSGSSSVSKKD